MYILVLNCGSSSLRYSVFEKDTGARVQHGKVERIGDSVDGRLRTHQQAVSRALDETREFEIVAVGYRVVHGGTRYAAATLIDAAVLAEIEARIPDAPMHNPYALAAIRATQAERPGIPHVAVFDTAFHATMPRRAKTYAIDTDVAQRHGIQRFGFHGTSHAWVAERAAEFIQRPLAELRLITLHLGNGASACAVEYGHSTETSMGNTPLEGLVMGSRSGDVDAGVLMTLLRTDEFTVDTLDDMLNNRSGLAGLSGVSNDLREIEDLAE
nr:acetate/propionate family kinase [Gammaproteobacteria bacterium]